MLMGATGAMAAGADSVLCASAIWESGGSTSKGEGGGRQSSKAADRVSTIVADESGVGNGGSARSGLHSSSRLTGSERTGIFGGWEVVHNGGGSEDGSSMEDLLWDPQRKLRALLRGILILFPSVWMLEENERILAGPGSSFVQPFHASGTGRVGGGGRVSPSGVL